MRRQVSSQARRGDCRATFVPLKHRVDGEYRDIPAAPFIDEEIDTQPARWAPVPVDFISLFVKHRRLAVFFAPRGRGKGAVPTASTYDYDFKKACIAAGLVDSQGRAKYTPRIPRDFFASTPLANGIPIHEVSRWLGHRSIKVTVDIYGHFVPRAWHRCREILQNAMRPAPSDIAFRHGGPVLDRGQPGCLHASRIGVASGASELHGAGMEPPVLGSCWDDLRQNLIFAGGSSAVDVPLQRVSG